MTLKHVLNHILLISCIISTANIAGAATSPVSPQKESFAQGRILVMPRAGLPAKALENILKEHGGKAKKIGQSNLYIVELPVGSEKAAVAKLAHNPHFKFAELDMQVQPTFVPNDPYFSSGWHLAKIGATTAWDTTFGSGVTIAVLDSGVNGAHPDLAAQMVPGWNFYDNNSNTSDVYGHGTKVAGSAAATSNNGTGVSAVAGQANIMPLRVTDTSGTGYTSMIASGVIYAADHGVHVANISFANQPSRPSVVSAAQYMKDKGGLVFVGAGNSGIDEGFTPTTSMIPVAATDANNAKASWSSYGNYVALSAPGVSIYSTVSGGGYGAISGTSVASPVAAGVAALMMSANPSLPNTQIESLLFSTALDLGATGRDPYYGYGRVDAAKAVQAAVAATSTIDTQVPTVSITNPIGSTSVTGLVPVDVMASDNVGVTRVELKVNNTTVAVDSTSPFAFSWDSAGTANGTANLVATAFDAAGNMRASSPVAVNVINNVQPPIQDTEAPVVAITQPMAGTVTGNITVMVEASDNSGAAGIALAIFIDGKQSASGSGGTLSTTWNTKSKRIKAGTHTIQATATDAVGNTATTTVNVNLLK